jgi:hypothetical protein
MPVPDAVVVSATRTAIGTAFKGTLVDVVCAGGGMSTAVVLDVPAP